MKVYLVTHEVAYEGLLLISIHESKLGADASAKKYLENNYPEVNVEKKGSNYHFSDSTIRIEERVLQS